MSDPGSTESEARVKLTHSRRVDLALWVAALVMAAAAVYRLPVEFGEFWAGSPGTMPASDLRLRQTEVLAWFDGAPVYGAIESADYPPASYVLLRPLVGYRDFEVARVIWALTCVAALAWLTLLFIRECRATRPAALLLVGAMPLACYATAATVRYGQVGVHLLACLVFAVCTLARNPRTVLRDAVAAAAFVAALCKPTSTAPCFWVLLAVGGIRTGVFAVVAYVALTLVGASYQAAPLTTLIGDWLGQSSHIEFTETHGNVYTWLGLFDLDAWMLPVSLATLVAAGIWTWKHRDRDVWLLLGVSGLVARLWTYHRWYDDVLILLPMVTLFREAKDADARGTSYRGAVLLFALLTIFCAAPASILALPDPWGEIVKGAKTAVWIATLVHLLRLTRRSPAAAVPG